MADENVLVKRSSLDNIANAIRSKNGTTNTYLPSEMAQAVMDISAQGTEVKMGVYNNPSTNTSKISILTDIDANKLPRVMIFWALGLSSSQSRTTTELAFTIRLFQNEAQSTGVINQYSYLYDIWAAFQSKSLIVSGYNTGNYTNPYVFELSYNTSTKTIDIVFNSSYTLKAGKYGYLAVF